MHKHNSYVLNILENKCFKIENGGNKISNLKILFKFKKNEGGF